MLQPHNLPLPGYYTQISTLADAQENVMEYLHVLSRPMAINRGHDIIWTEAYMDSKVGLMPLQAWGGSGWQSEGPRARGGFPSEG
jgi:hypothetical protein